MTRIARWTVVLALVLTCAAPGQADYEAGQRAWDAGRPDQALTEWRAAADAGDRRAMLALGRLYVQGLGVLQDYVEAHKWLSLAASRGEAEAVTERDALAAKMTPQQVATAQKRAAAWRPTADETDTAADNAPVRPDVTTAPRTAGPPPPRAIREAQKLLAALGYAPGPADGIWGARSTRAYRAFLRDVGRPATDTLTPQALRAMRAIVKRRGIEVAAERERPGARQAPRRDARPRPTRSRPNALHRAAQAGDIGALESALAAGADVNARDDRSWTALMHAVNKGYPPLVDRLLKAQADPDVRAPDGASALFMAALHGHTEIIALLMKAEADLSIRGPKDKSAVEVARTQYGDADAARQANMDPAVVALLQGMTLAQVEADDAAYARAQAAGTAAAYADYLSSWPQGRHAGEARRLRAKAEARPGRKLRDCEACPELIIVPAGSFRMGSPSGEKGRWDDEGPQHRVEIAEPFAVGVHEVTRGEFARFVRATGHAMGNSCRTYEDGEVKDRAGRHWQSPGFGQTDRHPVVCVSWDDARAYARWLSRETGKRYRLLSESEWEYVARAGTRTAQYWGESASGQCRHANGADASTNFDWRVSCNDGYVRTSPVGTYTKNGFGLYGVLGNVWEWVQDCWNESYAGAARDGRAWESGDCGQRVVRGGSWLSSPRYLRSADRGRTPPGIATSTLVSELPGRLLPESLPPYLGGPGGLAP